MLCVCVLCFSNFAYSNALHCFATAAFLLQREISRPDYLPRLHLTPTGRPAANCAAAAFACDGADGPRGRSATRSVRPIIIMYHCRFAATAERRSGARETKPEQQQHVERLKRHLLANYRPPPDAPLSRRRHLLLFRSAPIN